MTESSGDFTLSDFTVVSKVMVSEEVMERDRFMTPEQAKDFGIIDKVLAHPPLPLGAEDSNPDTS